MKTYEAFLSLTMVSGPVLQKLISVKFQVGGASLWHALAQLIEDRGYLIVKVELVEIKEI